VAGEGSIQIDPTLTTQDDQHSSQIVRAQRSHAGAGSVTRLPLSPQIHGLDPQRLNTAMQMLQSELDLAGSPLGLAENTDLLIELYEILGPDGVNVDAGAMMAFNRHLAQRLREGAATTIA
jgi:hypothetical protein